MKKSIGSTPECILKDEGIAREAEAVALGRGLAWQRRAAMRADGITRARAARGA